MPAALPGSGGAEMPFTFYRGMIRKRLAGSEGRLVHADGVVGVGGWRESANSGGSMQKCRRNKGPCAG
jgi:hypothetical protein